MAEGRDTRGGGDVTHVAVGRDTRGGGDVTRVAAGCEARGSRDAWRRDVTRLVAGDMAAVA